MGRDGKPNTDQLNYRTLIKRLRVFAGKLLVSEFGPNRLREFRETLLETGMARTTTNQRIGVVRRIFQWGVGREMFRLQLLTGMRSSEVIHVDWLDHRWSMGLKYLTHRRIFW